VVGVYLARHRARQVRGALRPGVIGDATIRPPAGGGRVIAHDLFVMQIPPAEKVFRTVAVYAGLAVLLRIGGKRDLAQLSTFDLVVMLLLSNVVQNAVIGEDNSLVGGLLGALVLIVVNAVWVRAVNRSPRLIRIFEGSPTVLVRDGRYIPRALRREGLRGGDIERALHLQGADSVAEVREATLTPGGGVVVQLEEAEQNASRGDLETVRRHLDDMIERVIARLDAMSDGGQRAAAESDPA
jgi:uncharacterized membrane protein YcaP (DUF421 family)